ncbi:MAG: TolC family protein [Bacteroidia bacterium]
MNYLETKIKRGRQLILFTVFLSLSLQGTAQQAAQLILDSCYKSAKTQYPLIKQRELIEKSRDYTLANASKAWLPQINVNGQATYQSAVTQISLPIRGFTMPSFSKDQYKVYAELDQTIYDGGTIGCQKEAARANAAIQSQSLEVDLYGLRDRINQIYFGVLLLDQQLKQNELVQKDLQSSMDRVRANIDNGTATPSGLEELQAELLQQEQNSIQLKASRKAYLSMLGQFINQKIPENSQLRVPAGLLTAETVKRPELSLFDIRRKSYDVQDKMLNASNRPRLSAFFQEGYGRPGLNPFDNNFDSYYIGGIRFSWALGNLYTLKDQRRLLVVNRQAEDIQKETFLFNTRIAMTQQQEDIQKLKEMLGKDDEIIVKRTSVTNADRARMENGVLTVNDYIIQLDKEDQAKQNRLLHQVQLLLAQYNYQNISGN